jgi:hypothetical protein
LYITLSPLGGASLTAINLWFKNSKIAGLVESIISIPTLLAFLLYIPARIVLLAIALRTLADIPATGHQSIEWSEFIPHI